MLFNPCKKCLVQPVCKDARYCAYITRALRYINYLFSMTIGLLILAFSFFATLAITNIEVARNPFILWGTILCIICSLIAICYAIFKREDLEEKRYANWR